MKKKIERHDRDLQKRRETDKERMRKRQTEISKDKNERETYRVALNG